MCLARSCLTVGHDDSIEAIEDVSHHRMCDLGVGVILARVHLHHAIESKVALVKAGPNEGY